MDLMACSVCLRQFPSDRYHTHVSYCSRNSVPCAICAAPVDKNFMEQHFDQYHKTGTCQVCGLKMVLKELSQHSKVCLVQQQQCQYCSLQLPLKDLLEHQQGCGSRTFLCGLCERWVVRRDKYFHEQVCKPFQKSGKFSSEQFQLQMQLMKQVLIQSMHDQ